MTSIETERPTAPVFPTLRLIPTSDTPLKPADFKSDQEVRWCPGCGDHAILNAFQAFMPSLGIPKENVVVVSGIGCSSRFPYYMDTYGVHSIHGRAPSIATGLSLSRPDLSVWVVTGDGDALSIGGNHLIHALRRNVNLKILLFNNQIYGLTKGQYSPTSVFGKVTKSSPTGSVDNPFNPISLALGSEATFVARTIDTDRQHLTETLTAAAAHNGTALVEIYQNCPMFNDGVYGALKDNASKDDWTIRLEHGKPLVFGANSGKAIVRDPATGDLHLGVPTDSNVVIHDARTDNPSYAFALSRLAAANLNHTPIGVFRAVERLSYDEQFRGQIENTQAGSAADFDRLLLGNDSWTIS